MSQERTGWAFASAVSAAMGLALLASAARAADRGPLALGEGSHWSLGALRIADAGTGDEVTFAVPSAAGFRTVLTARVDRAECGARCATMISAFRLRIAGESSPFPRAQRPLLHIPFDRRSDGLADGRWHTFELRFTASATPSLALSVDGHAAPPLAVEPELALALAEGTLVASLSVAGAPDAPEVEIRDWRWWSLPVPSADDAPLRASAASSREPRLVAAHDSGLRLVPKSGSSYPTDIHPIWTNEGCTGCHTSSHPTLDLTGSASAVYPRVLNEVDTGNPSASLILTKPQPGTVSHGGGDFSCFNPGQNCYDTILQWIQEGAHYTPCTYGINPTSRSLPAAGGSGSVSVTAGSGCTWTATSDRSWIHVTSGASGNSSGAVGYSVDGNASTSARSGSLTVAGLTFAISEAGASSNSPCVTSSTKLCLDSNRFEITASWQSFDGSTGPAQMVKLSDDTGYMWFFNAANVEVVIKVLDACVQPFDRYWVFAGGLTNVKVTTTVRDSSNGFTKTYTNALGQAFAPLQDTSSFATCP